MMMVRVVMFFMLVIITCCFTSYMLSKNFMDQALEAKNEVIEKQKDQIDSLIKQNEQQQLVLVNLRDIVKVGIKDGCIKKYDGIY